MSKLQARLEHAGARAAAGHPPRHRERKPARHARRARWRMTPHPQALGSALTHPHITTDYSESQLELITGVHATPETCLEELTAASTSSPIARWATRCCGCRSMPCNLPADENIPIGRYGSSNVGRAKSVYRMGLAHRYGRRMQTISGIHYNWSLPGVSSDAVLRADPQLPPPRLPAAVPVRRLAGGVLELRRRPRARAADAARRHHVHAATARRCAWAAWATRARRRPAWP